MCFVCNKIIVQSICKSVKICTLLGPLQILSLWVLSFSSQGWLRGQAEGKTGSFLREGRGPPSVWILFIFF